jgi:hypothetical protein
MKKCMLISMFLLAAGSCFAQGGSEADDDVFRVVVSDSVSGFAEIRLVKKEPGDDLFLERLDGSVTLGDAEDVGLVERCFPLLATANFSRISREGPSTGEMRLDMYCVTGEADLMDAFRAVAGDSLPEKNMDQMAMSQHQIVRFCEKNIRWMEKKYPFVNFAQEDSVHHLNPKILFLTKVGGAYFAVCVEFRDGELIAYSFELKEGYLAGCFLIICPYIERNHGRG